MWQFLTDNISTINGIILFLTLITIICYTIETRKSRLRIEEQLKIEKQKNEPNVIAYFDNGSNIYTILLVLSNNGQSPAHNVKLNSDPEIDLGGPKYKEYLYKNAVFGPGVLIPPNSQYPIRISSTNISSELYKKDEIPKSYRIALTFENMLGEKFESSCNLSIDQFFNRLDPENQSPIEKRLIAINEGLKSISDAIATKSNLDNSAKKT